MRKLVLWGHHFSEYQAMFDLSQKMPTGKLLEYGSGPSAVNAELHGQMDIVSIDSLFTMDKKSLQAEAARLFEARKQEVIADPTQFNMTEYGGMEAFFATRKKGMDLFFEDYEAGRQAKRYQAVEKEGGLAFENFTFDLALSSHYLFAGSNDNDIDFHLNCILELARVAKEVRIFPLIERAGEPSALLGPVLLGLQQANFGVEVKEVGCALYPQGNAMLRVWAKECKF